MANARSSLSVGIGTTPFAFNAASIGSYVDGVQIFAGAGFNYWTSGATPNASQGMPVPSGGYLTFPGDVTKLQLCAQVGVAPTIQCEFLQGKI